MPRMAVEVESDMHANFIVENKFIDVVMCCELHLFPFYSDNKCHRRL